MEDGKNMILTRKPTRIMKREMGMAQCLSDPLVSQVVAQKFAGKRHKSGVSGWQHLKPAMKAHIKAVLDDAARRYNCSLSDLRWCLKSGVIHVKRASEI